MTLLSFCALLALPIAARAAAPRVEISVDKTRVGMGRVVHVSARSIHADGRPGAGDWLYPYVNGRRWGSHEIADERGRAEFMLPLPMVGVARICVQSAPRTPEPTEAWIWDASQGKPGTIYLQKSFSLPGEPSGGSLWLAVDDAAVVYLNGTKVAEKAGWHDVAPVKLRPGVLRAGRNVLSVEATNGAGPCGLLLRLEAAASGGKTVVSTNADWSTFSQKPAGWPDAAAQTGEPARTFGRADSGAVRPEPSWPGIVSLPWRTGTPLPKGAVVSRAVDVVVVARKLQAPPADPNHAILIQWEEWFTQHNCDWSTAHAVPVMGFYDSHLREVARQHLIWFIESGFDTIMADWSNNIWNAQSWSEIGVGTKELDETSTLMMDEMARMRDEGYAVPKMTFLTGISYARPGGPSAMNGQLAHIWDHYVANPKYRGLWRELDGKPLVLALDCGATYYKEKIQLDPRFALRYCGAQQDHTGTDKFGFWSWMDHEKPVPTMRDGRVEALTVHIGSFGPGGWLARDARGRRNGGTIIEDWAAAMEYRPRVLQIHQFNEFAGQVEGSPAAPPNVYVDIYSPELSDDFEPTSLTAPAYRGRGGWGFLQLNIVRALVDLYRQPVPKTTVVTITEPLMGAVLEGDRVQVKWVSAGAPARSYTLLLNGRVVARGVKGHSADVSLKGVPPGSVTFKLVAEGAHARYALSWTEDSLPAARPLPASMELTVRRR